MLIHEYNFFAAQIKCRGVEMSIVNETKKMAKAKKRGEIINYLKMNYNGLYQINKMIQDSEIKKATK
jgi:hypothetical protein